MMEARSSGARALDGDIPSGLLALGSVAIEGTGARGDGGRRACVISPRRPARGGDDPPTDEVRERGGRLRVHRRGRWWRRGEVEEGISRVTRRKPGRFGNYYRPAQTVSVEQDGVTYTAECDLSSGAARVRISSGYLGTHGGFDSARMLLREYVAAGHADRDYMITKTKRADVAEHRRKGPTDEP
jgi:hypothetical protein